MQLHNHISDLLQNCLAGFSKTGFLFLILFTSNVDSANVVRMFLANNANPEVDTDTLVTTVDFTANVYPSVELGMKHRFQQGGGEISESSEISVTAGNPNKLYYKLSHSGGQHGYYFASSSTRVQLVKRILNTPAGGFYEYNEENYRFGAYRQIEFGPGYNWGNSLIYMGARLEKVGGSNISFLHLVSVDHQFEYVVARLQARLYTGPQYVFEDNASNEPEFGFRIKLRGEWLPPGFPQSTQLTYGLNGLLINRKEGVYRRFGAEFGFVYQY